MALLPNALDTIAITLVGTNNGHLWNNKFHLRFETAGTTYTSAQLSTLCDAVQAAWTTNIAPLCNPLVLLTDVNAVGLTDRDSPTFYSHIPTAVPGTRTGTALPASSAVCFSWRINRRYRGGHGRIYVPAGNIADMATGSALASAFLTSCQSAANAFHTALQGLTVGSQAVALIVLSYYHSVDDPSRPRPVPPGGFYQMSVLRPEPVPYTVNSCKIRSRFDTQRRRLGKELI